MKRIALLLLIIAAFSTHAESAKLAIIIDDIGNNKARALRTVNLPAPLNLAFLPHTPYAKRASKKAHAQGHLNMLHQPMASLSGAPLGAGGIEVSTPKERYHEILQNNLNSIYKAQGVNNHMGSLLTQNTVAMQAFMPLIKQRGLFFIDSRTSAQSVAKKTAQSYGIPTAQRNVFLDHFINTTFINQQFNQAVKIAKKRGFAILIGHPYPKTLDYLEQALPSLYLQNVELIRLDDYFQHTNPKPATQKMPQAHNIFLFGVMP